MRFWKLDSIGMNCNDAFRPRLREIKGRRRRERERKKSVSHENFIPRGEKQFPFLNEEIKYIFMNEFVRLFNLVFLRNENR